LAAREVRRWFAVLLACCLAVVPLLLWWGRGRWFALDEWIFLSQRSLSDPGSMFEAHNGHWVTIPVVEYQVYYRFFGIRSYRPYQLTVIASHLAVVIAAWLVMIRLRVRPSIATGTALPFLLFGSGAMNILWGIQVTMTGALALGLLHLLLADHDGPWGRRDAAGLTLGGLGLLFSAVSVPLVAAVATATLIRRGWRLALAHAAPLGVVFAAWSVAFGGKDRTLTLGGETGEFVVRLLWSAARDLGSGAAVGSLVVLLVLLGTVPALRGAGRSVDRDRAAIVAAMVVAAVGFAYLTAAGRAAAFGLELSSAERYVYVVAALLLPLLALGGEMLAGRYRLLGLLPVLLVAFGLPTNADKLAPPNGGNWYRDVVESVAGSGYLQELEPDMIVLGPAPGFGPPAFQVYGPTAGWLREGARSGRVRTHPPSLPQAALDAELTIVLRQEQAPTSSSSCTPLPATIHVDKDDTIEFGAPLRVTAIEGEVRSPSHSFDGANGGRLVVLAGSLTLEIDRDSPDGGAICVAAHP
jgi:hypothetical protein